MKNKAVMVLLGDSGCYEVPVSVSNIMESSALVTQPVPTSSRIIPLNGEDVGDQVSFWYTFSAKSDLERRLLMSCHPRFSPIVGLFIVAMAIGLK